MSALESEDVWKRRGRWEHVGMQDLDELVGDCDACGKTNWYRYEHTLECEGLTIKVGKDCGAKLLGGADFDEEAPAAFVKRLVNLEEALKRFRDSAYWKANNRTPWLFLSPPAPVSGNLYEARRSKYNPRSALVRHVEDWAEAKAVYDKPSIAAAVAAAVKLEGL
jgi:hypothetical protein